MGFNSDLSVSKVSKSPIDFNNFFKPDSNNVSFEKIRKALFNTDGTVAQHAVPAKNTGSTFGYGFAASPSGAGASTNL